MFVYIIIGVMTLFCVIALVRSVRRAVKRSRRRREDARVREANDLKLLADVDAWVEKIQAAETDADTLEVGEFPFRRELFALEGDLREALEKHKSAFEREAHRRKTQAYLEQYRAALPTERATLCVEMYWAGCLEDGLELTKKTVGERIVELLLEELASARAGDAEALLRVLAFDEKAAAQRGRGVSYMCYASLLSDADEERLAHSMQDWDDLVAQLLKTPSIHDFSVNPQPSPGTVRLMAAEALKDRSLTLGKIVLAFCSVREDVMGDSVHYSGKSRQAVWPYRQEIGDVLLAEVTKMVHSIHTERNLFVGQT